MQSNGQQAADFIKVRRMPLSVFCDGLTAVNSDSLPNCQKCQPHQSQTYLLRRNRLDRPNQPDLRIDRRWRRERSWDYNFTLVFVQPDYTDEYALEGLGNGEC